MTPNTKCILCKTKLSNMSNQLTFTSVDAQAQYFASTALKSYSDFTYIEKDRVIKVPNVANDVMTSNYVAFQNTYFSNKWFYAFITNIEYVSPHCTNIHISIDPWQTFQFDVTIGQCFVEREHVAKSDDIVGANTLPESVPLGSIVYELARSELADIAFIIGCKYDEVGTLSTGVHFGNSIFPCDLYYEDRLDMVGFQTQFLELQKSGNVLFIQSINKRCFGSSAEHDNYVSPEWWQGGNYIIAINKPTKLGNYTPVNKKLLTYPYCHLSITTGKGYSDYSYENFRGSDNDVMTFSICYECTTAPYDLCAPINYEEMGINFNKCITTSTYPQIPYQNNNTEYYNTAKSFLQNNINTSRNQAFASALSSIAGSTFSTLAMDDPKSVPLNIPMTVANYIANSQIQEEKNSLAIAQLNDSARRNSISTHGEPCGDILFNNNQIGFWFYHAHIKEEYARIIDDYFTKYGYSTLRVKKPNLNSRSNFNYIKTTGANIYGNCPVTYLNQLKQAFDNGITLWHNPNTMYNYDNN